MTNKQTIDIIKQTAEKYPNAYGMILFSKKNKEIGDFIYEQTGFLDKIQNVKKKTRVYCVIHNITELPKCKICNKEILKNIKSGIGFAKYCSPKCENKDPDVIRKLNETNNRVYGKAWSFQSSNNRRKSRKTMTKKYGVAYAQQNHSIKQKQKNTMTQKYGHAFPLQCEKIKNKAISTARSEQFKKFSNNKEIVPMFSVETYIEKGNDFAYTWKCEKCGSVFQQPVNASWFKQGSNRAYARCEKCYPYMNGSPAEEKEILEFIGETYFGTVQRQMKILKTDDNPMHNLEIDIAIPDKKLGFEFDGLFWHSHQHKGNANYHLMKTELARELGINLVHIFENEWVYKKEITKSRIKNLLGIYDKTVFARNCLVKFVKAAESNKFQNNNHIQGSVNSKISLGLFNGDELVALMTFSKCRFDKKHEWEMVRFCCKLGYHIPGAAGKLLKHFEKTCRPKSLVTYADRRWSAGKLYYALGFRFDHASKPDYWYFKGNELESRIKYQKHKLKNLLQAFDPAKTEVENMENNGFMRIYDCGNMVFVKEYP